ncbi:MAG: deoxyribose-phosphate aldolase [Nannocystaceae bacterium]
MQPSPPRSAIEFALRIDHTLLRADATSGEIGRHCTEARKYGFYGVCVNSAFVEQAATLLAASPTRVCTVIGFPLGATAIPVKAYEAELAVQAGADELDMVMAIGRLKDGQFSAVRYDIERVVAAAQRRVVKVIVESAALTTTELDTASSLAMDGGAQFVKTSTGFFTESGRGGATCWAVARIRSQIGRRGHVKASGGIRDLASALALLAAGADRLGTSASVHILKQWNALRDAAIRPSLRGDSAT